MKQDNLCAPGDKYVRISKTAARHSGFQITVAPNGSLTLIGNCAYRLYNVLLRSSLGDLTSILRELKPTRDARRAVNNALIATERLSGIRVGLPELPYRIQLIRKERTRDTDHTT